jgi:hypothetical protein
LRFAASLVTFLFDSTDDVVDAQEHAGGFN